MSHRPSSRPKRWKQAFAAGAGGAVVVGLLAATKSTAWPLLMGSFGSSAVIVFGFPESGFSKPGRVIGAHVLCTAIGLLCLHVLGDHAWSLGLSVGLSILVMLGSRPCTRRQARIRCWSSPCARTGRFCCGLRCWAAPRWCWERRYGGMCPQSRQSPAPETGPSSRVRPTAVS